MIEEKHMYFDQSLNIGGCLFENVSQKFPSHYHDYYVIGLIEQGTRLLTYKTSKYTLSPQSLLLINPGDSHRCTSTDTDLLRFRALHVPISTMQKVMYNINGCSEIPFFSTPIVKNDNLNCMFKELHALIISTSLHDNEYKKETLNNFIRQLSNKYMKYIDMPNKLNPKILQARKYIDDNYMKKIKIKQICKDIDISPTTLFVNFLRDMGISPRRYLITKKVTAAKKLLPEMDVKSVAEKLGFFDHSHFTRSFKSITGITPTQFKFLE